MGSTANGGFDFNNMMNGAWSGGWPMFLLGALVVAVVVVLVVLALRTSHKS
jgi:hypothetical protein